MKKLLRHLRAAAQAPPDGDLLEAFRERRDQAAFEALVRRHGPMVLGVCRRLLRNEADAEDAFQATFLVLARKAGSLTRPGLLGNWLYGVARRSALRARAMNAKRRARESQAAQPEAPADRDEPWADLLPLLDRELARLPEKYRAAVVLCELQGRSRAEAAGLLGIPEGTLSSRLATARKLLARRLSRPGVPVPLAALATALAGGAAPAAVPAPLLAATVGAAWGRASAKILTLTDGVVKAMFLERLRLIGLSLLTVALLGGAALTYAAQAGTADAKKDGSGGAKSAVVGTGEAPPVVGKTLAVEKSGPVNVPGKRLAPGERLHIRALDALPGNPINGAFQVEDTGKVALGPGYGRVSVGGLSIEEAEAAVKAHLSKLLRNVQVSVTRYDPVTSPDLVQRVEQLEKKVQALERVTKQLRPKARQ